MSGHNIVFSGPINRKYQIWVISLTWSLLTHILFTVVQRTDAKYLQAQFGLILTASILSKLTTYLQLQDSARVPNA